MKYPNHTHYQALYARYLDHAPEKLVKAARPSKILHGNILDICGGSGRLSQIVRKRGADLVVLIDQEPEMADYSRLDGVRTCFQSAENAFETLRKTGWENRVTAAFCQQGANYWFNTETATSLAHLMERGGQFIFNTFNQRPPHTYTIRQYTHEGFKFEEHFWCDEKNIVHHEQHREGLEPHITEFLWIAPETFRALLEPNFECEEQIDGKSTLWVCQKK